MGKFTTLCCAAALLVSLTPGVARADEWDKKTFLTFSGPVQIPGATLPAGTYTFEIANPDTSRHVIRVSSKDGSKHYGLFLTIPAERLDPPEDNIIMFAERPAGLPQAIQVWFYPGDRLGEEFVYPRNQAMQIAKATHKGVLSSEKGITDVSGAKSARVERVDESGKAAAETTTATTTAPANTVDGSRRSRADRDRTAGTSGQTTGTSGRNGRRTLPRTASNLTLFELVSAMSIAGALAARQLRRRHAEN